MDHLFIINPAAGKQESTAQLEKKLAGLSFDHQVVYTAQAGEARHIARTAALSGIPTRIYACGGDGTLNEVVNGAAGYPNVAVTCVPKGTGNDFLKLFGDRCQELFSDLEALAVGPEAEFDLIDCNGHLGIDMVCVGADARVGAGVHRYKRLPLVSGMGAYILSVVEVILRGVNRPMSVRFGDRTWDGGTALLCAFNGRHYGGGFMPVPEAMPDDGVLDCLMVPKIGPVGIVQALGKYARGRYKECPRYIWEYHGEGVTCTSQEEMVAAVDGEVLRSKAFTIRLSEKKIRFFYPAGASYQPQVSADLPEKATV